MKITKYLVSLAAAVGMVAGCYKPEMIQVSSPEDVIAPVLEAVEGPIEITAENMAGNSVEFKWSLADYGVMTEVKYAIEAANASAKATLTSGVTADTTALNANQLTAKIEYETLNQILFNDLKLADGIAEEVSFTVVATVGEYPAVYSNTIKVSCKVTAAEKVYPKLTVAGSYAYNSWTPGKGQFVFDFDGTDVKYSGMIDFGEDVSALNFKFVGTKWGENEFSVPEGTEQAAEAAELPLQAGGGDNIAAYTTHRFYNLTLDKSAPKVIKNFSFNQIGVIGDFNGWGEDVVMQFNAAKQKFYADVDFPADGGFKFRADAAWDVNWGSATAGLLDGGDNIPVTAGKYRVYVNMNNPAEMTYELNAKAYGTEENAGSTEPEPEPTPTPDNKGWGIVGSINGWGGDGADVDMKVGNGWLVAAGVELPEGAEIKFRLDGDWANNFGGTFAADTEVALVPGGDNFKPAAGTYDIYLNPHVPAAYFMTAGAAAPAAPQTWGIVGTTNGWGGEDLDMGLALDENQKYWVRKGVELSDGSEIKFRLAHDWAVNFGGSFSANAEITVKAGGDNFKPTAGTYDVYLDVEGEKAYFMTDGKTPADAGQAEVVIIDYSNCQMELVGSGVAAQDGATADLVWTWGNVLLASNGGKPVKAGDVYTWTWNNVVLTADGWKVRVLNAAESGGVANFDLGDGSVDKTASPNAQASNDGNIYVTAGTYNITLVIDAATDTKTVTVAAVAATPADPWATATSYDLPEGASSSRQVLRNIKFYADDNNINIRLVASVSKIAEKPTNGLTISFYDKTNGTAGEGFYEWWNKAIGDVEYNAERCGVIDGANLTMTVGGNPVDVQKVEDGDLVTWTFAFPRSANAVFENAKVYMGVLTLDADWNATGAMPDKYADMLEVTLP